MDLFSKVKHRLRLPAIPLGRAPPGLAVYTWWARVLAQWSPCWENQLSGQSSQRQGSQANLRRNQMWPGSLLSSCRPRLTLGLHDNVLWLGLRAGAQAEVASARRYCLLISVFHRLVFNPTRQSQLWYCSKGSHSLNLFVRFIVILFSNLRD